MPVPWGAGLVKWRQTCGLFTLYGILRVAWGEHSKLKASTFVDHQVTQTVSLRLWDITFDCRKVCTGAYFVLRADLTPKE